MSMKDFTNIGPPDADRSAQSSPPSAREGPKYARSPGSSPTRSDTARAPDDEHNFVVSDSQCSKRLRQLIPTAQGEISLVQILMLVGVIGCMAGSAFFCLSGVTDISFHFYNTLMGFESIWFYFMGAGLFGAFCLHAVNFYTWPLRMKAVPCVVIVYLVLIGCACHAKKYPSAPGLVVISQCPILLGLLRYHSAAHLRVSAHSFFKGAAACYFTMSVIVLVAWIVWLHRADMRWGSDTKEKIRSQLKDAGVFARYDLADWSECIAERALNDDASPEVISYCSRIELTAFLIYSCPLVECLILGTLGIFCMLRLRILERGATLPERTLRLILFFLLLLITSMWVVCSTAGASMGLSRAMLGCLGLACVSFAVWLLFVVDLEDVMTKAKGTVIFKTFEPAVRSDYFTALIFCFMQFFLIMFFVLEVVTRQLERLRGIKGSGSSFLTTRGVTVANAVRGKHWAITLEKSFNLCMLYLVLFLCSRFTPVFLSWLELELKRRDFSSVCGIFYIVGLIMFLLPPVPGVPVYIAAGTIIVARGKLESWLNFWSCVALTSVFCLILKLNAVMMQQKLIGQAFGRYLYIQQLVGVHTTSIRAIEKILLRPGLTLQKVAILCGGPDWPTSVLTGILRLSLPQMLLGTLPCFFLIIPCVLGGSSLNEEDLQSLSPVLIMMVGATQGGMMLAALIFIAKETERSYAELSKPLESHKLLVEKSQEVARANAIYKNATEWSQLNFFKKLLLTVSVFLELVTCFICFFFGSLCFRKFSIGNDIDANYSEGGLHGKVSNVVKDSGVLVFYAISGGLVLYILYKCITGRGPPKCENGPPPTSCGEHGDQAANVAAPAINTVAAPAVS